MSMSDRDGKIWMDGQLVEWRDAKIHVLSHTLHYGCGVFEGIRIYGRQVFRLPDHLRRLATGARAIGLEIPGGVPALRPGHIARTLTAGYNALFADTLHGRI